MALNPRLYQGRQLQLFKGNIALGSQPGNNTPGGRSLLQDGLGVLIPEGHIVRRVLVASNNLNAAGTITIRLLRWINGGDEAAPVQASSDKTITILGQAGADVLIHELTLRQADMAIRNVPCLYSLLLIGTDALDRVDDPSLTIGCEMVTGKLNYTR